MSTKPDSGRQGRKGSVRTCVRCRQTESPQSLVRWVRGPGGQVVPDLSEKQFGRGAWSHPTAQCLKGLSRALAKSFRAEVTSSDEELSALLGQAAVHRVGQLLGAGRRQGLLAFGRTPVSEAVAADRAHLLMVAADAPTATRLACVEQMVRAGKALVWGNKAELGKLGDRGEIAVLAVLDHRLAQRLFGAIAMAPRGSGVAGVPASHASDNSRFLTEVE